MSIRLELRIGVGPVHRPAPPDVMEALREATIRSSAGPQNGFQLSFWAGKGSQIAKRLRQGLFDPPARVIVSVVLGGRRHVLIDGAVTTQSMAPSNEAGASTLELSGLDLTAFMDLVDLTGRCFPAMPPFARAALVMAPYATYGVVPQVTPQLVALVANPIDEVSTQQGTDYAYLRTMAEQVGFQFYIEPGLIPGQSFGYWGPEVRIGAPQPALSVGSDAANNVDSLNFSFDGLLPKVVISEFFDRRTGRTIPIPSPPIALLKPPLGLRPPIPLKYEHEEATVPMRPMPPRPSSQSAIPTTDVIADNQQQMREHDQEVGALMKKHNKTMAEKMLTRLAYTGLGADPITASGSLDVMRYGHVLKAKNLVDVRGADPRYNGTYYVTSVSHTISPGSYTQGFSLARGEFNAQRTTVGV